MLFAKSLLIGAAALAAVLAQTSSQIAFTSTPATVAAGSKTTLKWAGGDDGQPVTITLRQGDEDNLKTVRVITGSATGGSFTWTVPKDLPSASDYALEISQGITDNNYSGMFTLTGGTASSSSSTTPSTSASLTSASAILQSAIATLNSTTTTLAAANVTTTLGSLGTGVVGTGVSGVGATGTGSPIHRNTTLSRATLSSTKSSSSSSTAAATTTSGSSGSSTTSSAPSSSSSSAAMEAAGFASPFALIFGAVAAIAYLG